MVRSSGLTLIVLQDQESAALSSSLFPLWTWMYFSSLCFIVFLCKTFRNLNHVFTRHPKPLVCFFSEGVVALKHCGAFCECGLPLASSDLFNHRLLCLVMLRQFDITKHFQIILFRNEII